MKMIRLFIVILVFIFTSSNYASAAIRYGIADLQGKEIVACKYRRIKCLSSELFYLNYLNKSNPIKPTYSGKLVDRNGKKVPVKIPRDCSLADVFIFDKTENALLPPSSLFLVHRESGFGLVKTNGDILLDPKYPNITQGDDGQIFVWKSRMMFPVPSDLQLIVNARNGETTSLPKGCKIKYIARNADLIPFYTFNQGTRKAGYIYKNGKIAILPKYSDTNPFDDNDLAIVSQKNSKGVFKQFLLDKKDRIVSSKYNSIRRFPDGTYLISKRTSNNSLLFGLSDDKGNEFFSPCYKHLDFLYDGIYLYRKHKNEYKAIDTDKNLVFEFPKGTISVYPPKRNRDNLIVCRIKESSSKATRDPNSRKFILINRQGKRILELVARSVNQLPSGKILKIIIHPDKKIEKVFLNTKGEVIEPIEHITNAIKPFKKQPDRILKYSKDNKFYPMSWKNPNNQYSPYINRMMLLRTFLDNYNFIGMHKSKVLRLLGKERALATGMCGNSYTCLAIEYDDHNRVKRWRIHRPLGVSTDWVTTNVVISRNSYGKCPFEPKK